MRQHLAEPLFRNAYWLVAAEVLTAGLGVLFWALSARLYSRQSVGESGAALAALLVLANVAKLNLPMVLLRFLPGAGPTSALFLRRTYVATTATGILLGAGFVVVAPMASTGMGFVRAPVMAAAIVAGVPLWCVFALQDAALTALRKAHWVAVENGLFSLVKIGLLVGLAGALPSTGVVVAWLVAMAVTVPPVNYYLFTKALHQPATATAADRRDVIRFLAADYLGTSLTHLGTTALPLIVVGLLGAEANALFSIAWTIGTALTMVAINTGYSLTVEGARADGTPAHDGRRALRRCLQLVTLGSSVVLVGADWILSVFGPAYADAAGLLRILAVAVLPASVNLLYLALLRVTRRLSRLFAVQAAEAGLILTFTVLLTPVASIEGIGLAWLIAHLLVCAAILPDLRRMLR